MHERLKKEIDEMTHLEMARLWRFSPIGKCTFVLDMRAGSELQDYFAQKFKEKGGMTAEISKKLWSEEGEMFKTNTAPDKKHNVIIGSLEMALYIGRWQLSTLTMTPVILLAKWLGILSSWEQVALANLISAPFFFFIDKFILVYVGKLIRRAIKRFKQNKEQ